MTLVLPNSSDEATCAVFFFNLNSKQELVDGKLDDEITTYEINSVRKREKNKDN